MNAAAVTILREEKNFFIAPFLKNLLAATSEKESYRTQSNVFFASSYTLREVKNHPEGCKKCPPSGMVKKVHPEGGKIHPG